LLIKQTQKEKKTFFVRLGIENKEKKTLQYPKNKADTDAQKSWKKHTRLLFPCFFLAKQLLQKAFRRTQKI
jgi:hypothetical protein